MSTRTTEDGKGRFVSPDELFQAAKNEYFEGKDPVTHSDWAMVVNYWAANVSVAEESVCLVLSRIYNCPLSDKDVKKIAWFQASAKLDRRS